MNGIIIKALSGFYYVSDGYSALECKARGSLRENGVSPLVGDRVEFEPTDEGKGIVNAVLPRKNELSRPPVANIDKLFIISSYEKPAPNFYVIDKISAIAEFKNIEPIIVFNKCDMGDFTEYQNVYKNAGFKVFTLSAETGEGLEDIIPELKNSVSAFTGNSGVGKSSILNSLVKNLNLETGKVSDKLGRGRHTTRHTEFISLPFGGYVADTPGFSAVAEQSNDIDFKEALSDCFPDFDNYKNNCRFTSCTHTCEKGCGVLEAVNNGDIEISRHTSYVTLFNELKDLKPWNTTKRK